MNMLKRSLLACAAAGALAVASVPAMAGVDLTIKIAPPLPRVEVIPAPRVGFVWAPGYWDYRGNNHVWVAGTWAPERRGYRYNAPVWVQRDGQWHLTRGHWARGDSDHDGVPNAADRDRDNDGIRNGPDRDRDGDGIRDRRDNHPNVPK